MYQPKYAINNRIQHANNCFSIIGNLENRFQHIYVRDWAMIDGVRAEIESDLNVIGLAWNDLPFSAADWYVRARHKLMDISFWLNEARKRLEPIEESACDDAEIIIPEISYI